MPDHVKRRKLILQAAARLLEHYGVQKTTVADIAREASVGVGTVYLEFGSKDDILRHVASERHQIILHRLDEAADSHPTSAERLRAVLDERVRAFRRLAEAGAHAADLVHCKCSPIKAAWRVYREAERKLVRQIVTAGMRSGEFVQGDPATVADAVLSAYSSFTPPSVFGIVDDEDWTERLDALHDIVLRGVSV